MYILHLFAGKNSLWSVVLKTDSYKTCFFLLVMFRVMSEWPLTRELGWWVVQLVTPALATKPDTPESSAFVKNVLSLR